MKPAFPTSESQKRFFLEWAMDPNETTYNASFVYHIRGNLNRQALKRACEIFVQNHPIVHTHYTEDGNQYYYENYSINDFFLEDTVDNEKNIHAQLQEILYKPFDLTKDILFKFHLLTNPIDQNEHYFILFTAHHIILDGRMASIVSEEITATYNQLLINPESVTEFLPTKEDTVFEEAVKAESFLLNDAYREEARKFWLDFIGDISLHVSLPYQSGIQSQQSDGPKLAESIYFELGKKETEDLKEFTKKNKSRLFRVLSAIYGFLISKYSNQNKILISYPVDNRLKGYTNAGGCFVNNIPLKIELDEHTTLEALIASLDSQRSQAKHYQYYSLTHIVSDQRKYKNNDAIDNFNVGFASTNLNSLPLELKGLKAQPLDIPWTPNAISEFILCYDESDPDKIKFKLLVQRSLFDDNFVNSFIRSFQSLIKQISVGRVTSLKDYQLLSSKEYNRIIYEWNQTEKKYPQDTTLQQLFETQVEKTPDHVAVVFEEESLTYLQLNAKANQLARYIKSIYQEQYNQALKSDTLIGLCMEKSLDAIIAILGILKAGGAYIPIDPKHPYERIDYMLRDSKASLLVTHRIIVKGLESELFLDHKTTIFVDEIPYADISSENLSLESQSHSLAYIIYTSGTTGNPKGVMITHAAVINTIIAMSTIFNINTHSRVLQFASISFDASVAEIFNALLSGACLVLCSSERLIPGETLALTLQKEKISVVLLPPAALQVTSLDKCTDLKTLAVGGDKVSLDLVKQWSSRFRFINAYGPTEASICAAIAIGQVNDSIVTIGRALANVKLYVLDNNLKPVPIGVTGELCIGGAGLARGYLNRPELSTQLFIPNPFATPTDLDNGYDRLYKTGDLVRWLPDGNLEYIGRNDLQVKIRGYRIELGEIEQSLLRYPGIRQAIVLAKESHENKYLVAYYVADISIDNDRLISYLVQHLPDYMIPRSFTHLMALPLTANGKLDKKALPEPVHQYQKSHFAAPRNELESLLCTIWQEVLAIPKVGIHDNFFKIGGHSISAIKLTHRISECLHQHLNVAAVFQHKTIANLADFLQSQNEIVEIPHVSTEEAPLSYAQERLWFIEQYAQGTYAYNIPILLNLAHTIDLDIFAHSLQAVVLRHEVLRTLFIQGEQGQCYQQVSDKPLKIIMGHITKNELSEKIQDEVQHIFDLRTNYPIRIALYTTEFSHYALINIHHIAFDGWSHEIFLQELDAFYHHYAEKSPLDLSPMHIQYKDFAIWQRSYLSLDKLDTQIHYWQEKLKNHEPLNLFSDFQRPHEISYNGDNYDFEINPELSQKLKELAQEKNVSLFSLLLTGFYILLYKYTGQEDLILGTPVANRHYQQLAHLIGFFVNTLPLRANLQSSFTIDELLAAVQLAVSEMQFHQDLPFEKLIESLNLPRDPGRHPLFQITFALQQSQSVKNNIVYQELPITEFYKVAKFDLSLTINDSATQLYAQINYATGLYHPKTIVRFAQHYLSVLEKMVQNTQHALKDIPILSPSEYNLIIREWNQITVYPNKTLVELFENQVEKTPDHIAIIFETQSLTYEELNAKANQLARYLRTSYQEKYHRTLAPDTLIALGVERNLDIVIGILGILKSGSAYVPIDPNFPSARISYLLENSQAAFIVTQPELADQFMRVSSKTPILFIEDAQHQSTCPLHVKIHPDQLAYVIYTSGTTGQPKGVLQTHSNVTRLFASTQDYYQFNDQDVWVLFHSFVFDVSVWEMWGALLHGGKLIIPSFDKTRNTSAFYQLCQQYQITVLNQTPSAFYPFMEIANEPLPYLRYIIFAGEALNIRQLKTWWDKFGYQQVKLINMYGITETTVHVTLKELSPEDMQTPNNIGKPLPDLQAYVLDTELQSMPIGVPGELYVGGAGLARGYLNRPELTQARFIPNPFATSKDIANGYDRLYKTGDLVRWLENGDLEYIGRNDFQVKIHGYRIELGEIENILLNYPSIRQAAVLAKESQGNKSLVAYYVSDQPIGDNNLLTHLQQHLPDYMLPQTFVYLTELPLTINGKLDQKSLDHLSLPPIERKESEHITPDQFHSSLENNIENEITEVFNQALGIEHTDKNTNFFELGANSFTLARIHIQLHSRISNDLTLLDLFKYPTIAQLSQHIERKFKISEKVFINQAAPSKKIAIIGMSGKFPGAQNIDEFWKNVLDNKECNTFLSSTHLENFVAMRSAMDGIFEFDPAYFGINAQEASLMDPQQRHFLMGVLHAIESAGYDPQRFTGKIGLVGSNIENHYGREIINSGVTVDDFQFALANEKDFLTTKVSYFLNLFGPSFTLQSACSSSLVATHIAAQLLLNGECDIGVAGGISIDSSNLDGYFYKEGHIFSKDGHCRPFDAKASGTYAAYGYGFVVLKKLEQAIAEGDTIYAVIEGSAINNDGRSKAGYTAPGLSGQVEVIRSAHKRAGTTPDLIGYVEAHGTATQLGDPLEVAALTESFAGVKKNSCALASVKSQFGHLGAAAGVGGLIRATLALYHKKLPPNLNYLSPNPALLLDKSPFYINEKCCDWSDPGHLRYAGVSSFGIGGTNAHMILSEFIPETVRQPDQDAQLLILSAKTQSALIKQCHDLSDYMQKHQLPLVDVAYTLQQGRAEHAYRCFTSCRNNEEAIGSLNKKSTQEIDATPHILSNQSYVFLFPGQGSLFPGMGAALYQNNSQFKFWFDQCAVLLKNYFDQDIRAIFNSQSKGLIEQSEYSQPILFAFEYALARSLQDYGIAPSAMLGHSTGEYVAACLAQVWPLESALKIICKRGKLVQSIKGSMLSVKTDSEALRTYLNDHIEIAAINAPDLFTLTGDTRSIQECLLKLKENHVPASLLNVHHPFHSKLLDPILSEFYGFLQEIDFFEPKRPFLSNVTGDWITQEEAMNLEYWVKHLRNCVQYSSGLEKLLSESYTNFIEVGPGVSLINLIKNKKSINSIATIIKNQESDKTFLDCIGECWRRGLPISWSTKGKRIMLPGYSFDLREYNLLQNNPLKDEKISETMTKSSRSQSAYAQIWRRLIKKIYHIATQIKQFLQSHSSMRKSGEDISNFNRIDTDLETPLETQLKFIFSKHLGYEVSKEDNFFAVGGHSLLSIEVVSDINKLGKRKISITDFVSHDSVEKLLILLNSNEVSKDEKALIQLNKGVNDKNLFLIHPIGGEIIAYETLIRHLSPDYNVYAIQDLGEKEGVLNKADYYTQLIRDVQANGPYYIGGWSFGGLIANEIALRLESNSSAVCLILIDPPDPNPRNSLALLDEYGLNYIYIREIAKRYKIDVKPEQFSGLSDLSQIFRISPEATAYLNRILRVFGSNVKAISDYSVSKGVKGNVYLYQATQNSTITLAEQWRVYQLKLIHEYIEGDHYTILQEPNIVHLAKKIDSILRI